MIFGRWWTPRDAGIIGARDRALILLGFAGAFRRSELVALGHRGLRLRQGRSDGHVAPLQDRSGRRGPQDRNTVWIESRDVPGAHDSDMDRAGGYRCRDAVPLDHSARAGSAGPVSGIDVARIVKKLAVRAGLDPAKYAGHSLRAGHATAAAIAGASERSIMKQTGHRSVQMVRRYIRDGSLFRENSAGKLGL